MWTLDLLTLRAAERGLTIWEIFYLLSIFLKTYLKEKCLLEARQQLAFKYFVNFRFIHKSELEIKSFHYDDVWC